MYKRILIILVGAIFIFGISKISFAMMCGSGHEGANSSHQQLAQTSSEHKHEMAPSAESLKEAINVGNKICPVSGDKINEKTKATYEYEGKIYNFCCPMCIEEFKKDPDKYIKKVEEELKTESKEETQEETVSSHQMHEGMH